MGKRSQTVKAIPDFQCRRKELYAASRKKKGKRDGDVFADAVERASEPKANWVQARSNGTTHDALLALRGGR